MKIELIFFFFLGKVQHPSIGLGKVKFKEKTNISKERWENTENKNS